MHLDSFYPMFTTTKLEETTHFYVSLGFRLVFANDFYVHLEWPGTPYQLGYLLPNHPTQQTCFRKPFRGEGFFLGLETKGVDDIREKLWSKGIPVLFEPRDEPWGDRHFAVRDPNGVVLDIIDPSRREEMIGSGELATVPN
jgi:catechol 2,3-dioxygenase-like lactoylglutathione lyase family enzyme